MFYFDSIEEPIKAITDVSKSPPSPFSLETSVAKEFLIYWEFASILFVTVESSTFSLIIGVIGVTILDFFFFVPLLSLVVLSIIVPVLLPYILFNNVYIYINEQ